MSPWGGDCDRERQTDTKRRLIFPGISGRHVAGLPSPQISRFLGRLSHGAEGTRTEGPVSWKECVGTGGFCVCVCVCGRGCLWGGSECMCVCVRVRVCTCGYVYACTYVWAFAIKYTCACLRARVYSLARLYVHVYGFISIKASRERPQQPCLPWETLL